jgi:hypothetical protein
MRVRNEAVFLRCEEYLFLEKDSSLGDLLNIKALEQKFSIPFSGWLLSSLKPQYQCHQFSLVQAPDSRA